MPEVSLVVMSAQLCWPGHAARMADGRLPKDILYGKLFSGTQKYNREHLWYKDVLLRNLKKADINPSSWEELALDHTQGRDAIRKGGDILQNKLKDATLERHKKYHTESSTSVPALPTDHICSLHGKQYLSGTGLQSIKNSEPHTLIRMEL